MRALITGGAGFIGSHLADFLLDRGDEVILLDDLSTGRYANIRHLLEDPDVEFVLGSVTDAEVVEACVRRAGAVFHLAAAVGVELIVSEPLASLTTNIRGTEIVLEQAHQHDVPTLVTSSSEIYGKNTSDLLHEDEDRILGSPLISRWSYSEAKAVDEALAHTYWRDKGLPTVITRLFNTVGPRQTGTYGMVIPRFVNQAIHGEALTVYGDGTQTRCFCYVGDVVAALVALLEHTEARGDVFNLGGSEEVSIEQLAKRVISVTDSTSPIRYVPYDEAYEKGFEDMPRRVPDTSKAHRLIGFEPTVSLNEIIAMVVEEQRS